MPPYKIFDTQVSVPITADMKFTLAAVASIRGLTTTDIVRQAIAQFIEDNPLDEKAREMKLRLINRKRMRNNQTILGSLSEVQDA